MSYDQWKLASPDDYAEEEPEQPEDELQEEPCEALEDLEERCGMVGEPDEFAGKVRFSRGKKFDLQLSQAVIDERRLAQIFCEADFSTGEIELKTERHQWEQTGNVVIEYESYGKPSGIAATTAHIWVHELAREGQTLLYLLVPMARLREICEASARFEDGGDNKAQKGYLLKLTDLLR